MLRAGLVEVSSPRNGERERRPTGGRGWNRVRACRRLQAEQTTGFIQMNGKAITVKHDVTAGVTNAVTESVTASPAVTVDHWVTAGVTEAVTDTVTRVVAVKLRRTPLTFATLFGCASTNH